MGNSSHSHFSKVWPIVSLIDISSKIGSGSTPRGGQGTYLSERSKFALIRSQNVFDRRFSSNGLAYISDEQAHDLRNVELHKDDILLNITGDGITFARACIVPPNILPACVNQHVAIIRVNHNVAIPGFILSFLTHRGTKTYIESFNAGGSRRAITKGHIESFKIPLPPRNYQKAIAHILGTLDDKIELNRRMNATLEGMAQALFKSWFVDFDPVIDKALAAGHPIPEPLHKRAGVRRALGEKRKPLPEAIESHFPDRFVFSEEMGWVPEGWKSQPLYEVAKFVNGAAFKSEHFCDDPESLPVVKIAEIKNGLTGQTKYTTREMDEKYLIDNGEILLSWSGNPDTSIDTFIWTNGPGVLNQHIFRVVLKDERDRYFVYYQLKVLRPVFAEIARDKQTTGLGHFTAGDMKRIHVLKPTTSLLYDYNTQAPAVFDRWYRNLIENRSLVKLRNTLLPKLLSGELPIPNAGQLKKDVL